MGYSGKALWFLSWKVKAYYDYRFN
jgi:hypothetical protein